MDTNLVGRPPRRTPVISTTDLKLAPFPTRSPLPIAALPSISLIPSARFTDRHELREEQRTTDHTDDTDGSDEIRKGAAAFCTKCFWSGMRPRIAFARAPPQKKSDAGDACALQKSRDCGTKRFSDL